MTGLEPALQSGSVPIRYLQDRLLPGHDTALPSRGAFAVRTYFLRGLHAFTTRISKSLYWHEVGA